MPRSPRNALPTHLCRFWYGRRGRCLGIFLGGVESATSPCGSSRVSGLLGTGFPWAPPYALSRGRPEPRSRILPRRPIGRSAPAPARECLPVVHRLRLPASPKLPADPGRISLAQETLGFRRSGFSPLSRYSCLHPHVHAVHRGSRLRLRPAWKAPLPIELIDSAASAPCLSPAHCRRAPTRPVSCYALFECMAASKPTSWLSRQTHILCHSARTWGP